MAVNATVVPQTPSRASYVQGTTIVGPKGDKGDKGDTGYAPEVTITEIENGHRVTITDDTHPAGQAFDVMNGEVQRDELGDLAFSDSASTDYTPAGTVSKPNVTVTPTTASISGMSAVGTLPSLSMTIADGVLELSFDQGTLPTQGTAQTVLTGITAELDEAPVFTGTEATIEVS